MPYLPPPSRQQRERIVAGLLRVVADYRAGVPINGEDFARLAGAIESWLSPDGPASVEEALQLNVGRGQRHLTAPALAAELRARRTTWIGHAVIVQTPAAPDGPAVEIAISSAEPSARAHEIKDLRSSKSRFAR